MGDLPLAKVEQPAPGQSKDAAAIPLVTEEERVQIQDQMRKVRFKMCIFLLGKISVKFVR